MLKPVAVAALPDYRIRLKYSDGVTGEVDLSHLVGKGVFSAWSDQETFREVSLGDLGQIRWSDDIELCPDALYLEITGRTPEELFPNLEATDHTLTAS